MRDLVKEGRMQHFEGLPDSLIADGSSLQGVNIKLKEGGSHALDADHVLVFFGLHPKLGPIAEWGLELEKKALKVDTEKFQTSLPGVFAVGDINTYPGKKKLILSGFHEAALAAFAIQHHLFPRRSSSCSTRPRARSCISGSAFQIDRPEFSGHPWFEGEQASACVFCVVCSLRRGRCE